MPTDHEPSKPPTSINPQVQRKKRAGLSVEELLQGLRTGDRVRLSQAITLVESSRPEDQERAEALVRAALPYSGQSMRVGISGAPGVGKSTFIESFGQKLLEQGHRPAVLAVDPSSQLSKGSILGDKTRMPILSADDRAFVRPSPTAGSLGGVARQTREAIILCEAAGYDFILVETVGVGQSEVAVHALVDFFILLLQPGAGDELQGIKRGIVELADLVAVNKADGEQLAAARHTRSDYARALHLLSAKASGWSAPVLTCSAKTGDHIEEIGAAIEKYQQLTRKNGYLTENRRRQALEWMRTTVRDQLLRRFYGHPAVRAELAALEAAVMAQEMTPHAAAARLLRRFEKPL